MIKKERRIFQIDSDTIQIEFTFDEKYNVWIGDYPCFEDEPRATKNGRLWKHVSFTDCPYAPEDFLDCGSCTYLKKQHHKDLIGVCFNDKLRLDIRDDIKEESL